MEIKKNMPYERCALRLLRATTDNRVLKNALTRILGETPVFEVDDKVVLQYGDDFNGVFATILRRKLTKDGLQYAVQIDGCSGEIEGFSGDDMELNDRTSVDEYHKLHTGVNKA